MTSYKNNLGKKIMLLMSGLMMTVASALFVPVQANAQVGSILGGVVGGALGGCGSALTSAISGLFSSGGSSGGGVSTGGLDTGDSGGGSNSVPVSDATVAANTATIKSNTTSTKNVQCTWNGVAWQLAHVVLHSLTTSVVNWINNGFAGQPSFLTNPQGFFLDAADQVTGAFLAGSGPLSQLCSPFSADIRVALALEQAQSSNSGRYSCTLSKIVSNVQKGVNVTVNGQNVNGFMKGNFSAGGWPAFITMTTVPQNNPFGAYLQSSADLNAQIGARHASISADLQLGGGFLSWNSCTNVNPYDTQTTGGLDSLGLGNAAAANKNGQATYNTGNGSSYKATADSSGNVTYQDCQTQTPGSVISASLNKQLGASSDELNMTNEINQVVSALFSQLMKQVLTGGLRASSQSSGGSQSYTDQLANDQQMNQNFTALQQQVVDQLAQDTSVVKQAASYRGRSLDLINSQQDAYAFVQACIANDIRMSTSSQISSSYAGRVFAGQTDYLQSQLSALNAAIATNITPEVATYKTAAHTASTTLAQVQYIESQIANTTSAQDLVNLNTELTTELSSLSSQNGSDPGTAASDFQAATALSSALSKDLIPYQNVCSGVASSTPASSILGN